MSDAREATPYVFTTLRHPVEKLLEAEYFLGHLVDTVGLEFQFEDRSPTCHFA